MSNTSEDTASKRPSYFEPFSPMRLNKTGRTALLGPDKDILKSSKWRDKILPRVKSFFKGTEDATDGSNAESVLLKHDSRPDQTPTTTSPPTGPYRITSPSENITNTPTVTAAPSKMSRPAYGMGPRPTSTRLSASAPVSSYLAYDGPPSDYTTDREASNLNPTVRVEYDERGRVKKVKADFDFDSKPLLDAGGGKITQCAQLPNSEGGKGPEVMVTYLLQTGDPDADSQVFVHERRLREDADPGEEGYESEWAENDWDTDPDSWDHGWEPGSQWQDSGYFNGDRGNSSSATYEATDADIDTDSWNGDFQPGLQRQDDRVFDGGDSYTEDEYTRPTAPPYWGTHPEAYPPGPPFGWAEPSFNPSEYALPPISTPSDVAPFSRIPTNAPPSTLPYTARDTMAPPPSTAPPTAATGTAAQTDDLELARLREAYQRGDADTIKAIADYYSQTLGDDYLKTLNVIASDSFNTERDGAKRAAKYWARRQGDQKEFSDWFEWASAPIQPGHTVERPGDLGSHTFSQRDRAAATAYRLSQLDEAQRYLDKCVTPDQDTLTSHRKATSLSWKDKLLGRFKASEADMMDTRSAASCLVDQIGTVQWPTMSADGSMASAVEHFAQRRAPSFGLREIPHGDLRTGESDTSVNYPYLRALLGGQDASHLSRLLKDKYYSQANDDAWLEGPTTSAGTPMFNKENCEWRQKYYSQAVDELKKDYNVSDDKASRAAKFLTDAHYVIEEPEDESAKSAHWENLKSTAIETLGFKKKGGSSWFGRRK